MTRLATIDPGGWSIPQQVDDHLVRAEMNGLDFDHQVLKPWANNRAFYVTVFLDESDQPAREGPFAIGAVGSRDTGRPPDCLVTGAQTTSLLSRSRDPACGSSRPAAT